MNISKTAIAQIYKILETEEKAIALRIGIAGGGCSGFNYVFNLAEEIATDDIEMNFSGAIVVIDPMSMNYLEDATVDYITSIEGSRFVVNNPMAKTSCGCGSSFSI